MSAQISQKNISVRIKTYNAPNIRFAASNNMQRSAKYVQIIFENQKNQEIRPFCTTSDCNDNS